MSPVFVDTSALFALLVASDANHARARRAFRALAERQVRLLTSSYVLVESYALLQRRVGHEAVRGFGLDVTPLLEVVWIDAEIHDRGVDRLLARATGKLSLVDAVSFEVIRSRRADEVFAYDRHFEQEGFTLLG